MNFVYYFNLYLDQARQFLAAVPELATAATITAGLLLVSYIFRYWFLPLISRTLIRNDESWLTGVLYAVEKIDWLFYVPVAFLTGALFVDFSENIVFLVQSALLIILVLQLTATLQRIIRHIITRAWEGQRDATAASGLKIVTTLALWVAALTFILSSFGVKVTTLVASLGVVGIAVAFAIQNILADIFSSFSIYFDRPFRIGDKIAIGDDTGIVRRIGLKTTRIETSRGEELVIPNKELTGTRIRNFRRMHRRQHVGELRVAVETNPKSLKKIPGLVTEVFTSLKGVTFERIFLKELNGAGLVFEFNYFIEDNDGAHYLDVQNTVNFGILEALNKEGIQLAVPTANLPKK